VAEAQVKALRRQVTVESAVAVGLMLTVAVLVQTPAPRFLVPASAFQPKLPFTTLINADDLSIHAQVTPNEVGQNRFWLHLYHESGTPIGDVQLVQLRFNYQDAQLGQASVDLEPLGHSTYAVEGAYLSQAGNWEISIYVRRRGLDDTLTKFSVNVPVGQTANVSPWVNPVPTVPGLILAAGILLALGIAPLVWRIPLESAGSRIHSAAIIAGMVVLALALGLSLAGAPVWRDQIAAQQAALRTNPIPASPESLAQGQALYSENCAPCHGPQGRGDGPLGLTLPIHPANLQVHMVPGVHSDAQIFDWITNGYPNSPMPAFGKVFTEEQRWHILNYIRTLIPSE
jgi:mono/diheme cytochrome c family protein